MSNGMKPGTLGDLAADMMEATAAAQEAGLRLLQAEMQALGAMMPGLTSGVMAVEAAPERSEDELRAVEAAVEAGFDNMPV